MREPFRALYLHVPFCVRRCSYCDFHTRAVPRDDARLDAYADGLAESLGLAAAGGLPGAVETVYMGGGTPTFLGARRLGRLLAAIEDAVDVARLTEFTVEANPESLTGEVADLLADHGASRLSIGVQSLDDAVLKTLGRAHTARQARAAVAAAAGRIGNVSADVICGVPGQSADSLRGTICQLLDLGVSHVSIYPLMVEEGTPLERAIERGDLPDVDDGAQADHMLLAEEMLAGAGFGRYEVASYARPGFESRHNSAYWTGAPYLGLGEGASSMFSAGDWDEVEGSGALWRAGSLERLPRDAARVRIALGREGADPEFLTSREAACEDAMLAMRMSRGLARARLEVLMARAPELGEAAARAVDLGLARWSGESLAPTELGWLNGNELYALFWNCASI